MEKDELEEIRQELHVIHDRLNSLEDAIVEKIRSPIKKEFEKNRFDRRVLLAMIGLLALTLASIKFDYSSNGEWRLSGQGNEQIISKLIEVLGTVGVTGASVFAISNLRRGKDD